MSDDLTYMPEFKPEILLKFVEGFEFEVKCVDGWHLKKVDNRKNLNYKRLIELIEKKQIRFFFKTGIDE